MLHGDKIERRISTHEFRNKIKKLPYDKPEERAKLSTRCQKEHWLSWLFLYNYNGAYGRTPGQNRDAKWAYNHIVCPEMLLYLAKSININSALISEAEKIYETDVTEMHKAGEIRKLIPWTLVYETMFANEKPSLLNRLGIHIK